MVDPFGYGSIGREPHRELSVIETRTLPRIANEEPATRTKAPSFREIYEAHVNYVWSSLRRLGVRESDLEDVAHDLFVAVYKRFGTYDPSKAIRPWLFGFAIRFASDYRDRAGHRREVIDIDVDMIDEATPLDQAVDERRRSALVRAALDGIELDRRAVFVMHDIDGMSVPEIADALDVPLNTAYSRLRLARDQFTSAVRRLQTQRELDVKRASLSRAMIKGGER